MKVVWVLSMALLLCGCSLPALKERDASYHVPIQNVQETRLGIGLSHMKAQHEGLSGYYPLVDSLDAFAARMLLVYAADRTLDVQYYIWRKDLTGVLLLGALYEAAERGVRVRLLLDDHGTKGLDDWLYVLNAHENIEVRLFNPFASRSMKFLRFIGDFSRAQRRMHNKSFTADNLAAIVGGRNVGDEYFGATEGVLFADLDVLAVGPVVQQTSSDFDHYWQSIISYPLEQLVSQSSNAQPEFVRQQIDRIYQHPRVSQYVNALRDLTLIQRLLNGEEVFDWAKIDLVSDDPVKVLMQEESSSLMLSQLDQVMGQPSHSMDIVSPYFVPGVEGSDILMNMQQSGIPLRILTNSREATDVVAVHAGYAKYRKRLLNAGIELYEMRRDWSADNVRERAGFMGSSGASLHAKTFAVDEDRVFIGSFNFDPRSAQLNTEMGYVIHSPSLAKSMDRMFDELIHQQTYRLRLDEHERLEWHLPDGTVLTKEPGSTFLGNIGLWFLSVLPIEGFL